MENIDLNLDNYDYNDILNLFKLSINFNANDLKNAKTKVLMVHPDKCKLDKKYFLFFSSAYKILYSVYEFREKASNSENNNLKNTNIEYLASKDETNELIIKKLIKDNKLNSKKFNSWFNELFEKVKINNDYDNNGYGDWLQDNNIVDNQKSNNLNEMNEQIMKHKKKVRENLLTKYSEINEFNNNSYCDLTNSVPEEYSSGLFSKFQYEDLKKAHSESVIPVTDDDYKTPFNNIDEIKNFRQQHIQPISQSDAQQYLTKNRDKENSINSYRAFSLIKQQENIDKANKQWWASLKQLK